MGTLLAISSKFKNQISFSFEAVKGRRRNNLGFNQKEKQW